MLAFLVSSGFSNKDIYNLVKNKVIEKRYKTACILTTAHPKKEDAYWVRVTQASLEEMGLVVSFVDWDKDEVINTDVVYVTGGNTFHLLAASNKVDGKQQILNLFERGGMYIGSSAGAVIFSPTIDSAAGHDSNDDNLEDLTSYGFIDFSIYPHSEKVEKKGDLMDGEGIYLDGDICDRI